MKPHYTYERVIVTGYSADNLESKINQFPHHQLIFIGGDRGMPTWAVLQRSTYEDGKEE